MKVPDEDSNSIAVSVRDLYFAYETSYDWILKNINLEVRQGEHVAIIGPSGAGKTTLCFCMSGVVPHLINGAVKGEVKIFGKSTSEQSISELSRKVGLILDDPETQLFNITVEDEVSFGPQNLGLRREEILERVEEALKWMGLESLRHAEVHTLSGGQKQRVAIASVLAMRPRILILDEPTSMLDPVGTNTVFYVLDKLRKKEDMTIIMVEHKVEKIVEFAERVYFMAGGSILLEGKTSEVLSQVERITSYGIEPPQVTMMQYQLSSNTPSVAPKEDLAMTLDQGEKFLRRYLRSLSY